MSSTIFTRSPSIGLLAFSLVFLTAPAWARASSLEGVVKDPNGRPVSGADVRIESKRDSNWIKVVKTDGKGHYLSPGMPAGTYQVTLSINGSVKSSINNTKVITGDTPTELNFDLKP